MNIFEQIKFFLEKPKVTLVTSANQETVKKVISRFWERSFWPDKKVEMFGRKEDVVLPSKGYLVLDFDEEDMRRLKDDASVKVLTFGLGEEADFTASDIKINGGTNFKINYGGNIVPVWLEERADKEQIRSILAAASVGTVLGLNLVEISQALKDLALTSVTKGDNMRHI